MDDLRGRLERNGALAPGQALRLAAQLGEQLGAAHRRGAVHGAVEPGNILLSTARDGSVIGRLRDTGHALGADRAYAAPERHHQPAATARGDIYSLGCVLWACLTGAPPYSGPGRAGLRLVGDAPVPLELDALLEGMLRADPADRFSSAAEIAREAAWIADRVDPGRQVAADPATGRVGRATSAWKNLGMAGLVGIALLVIAVGAYAVVRLGDGPAEPSAAAAPPAVPSTAAAPPPPSPSAVVQRTPFTCWNGRTVRSRKKCAEPHGTRGVYWVFPLLQRQNCRPRLADSTPGRRMLLECYFYGRQVKVNVSMWRDTPTGVGHYADFEHLGAPTTRTGSNGRSATFGWEAVSRRRGYPYLAVSLWRKHGYSVAVYARRHALAGRVGRAGYLTPVPDDRYYGSKGR